jgi:hypothetical protein
MDINSNSKAHRYNTNNNPLLITSGLVNGSIPVNNNNGNVASINTFLYKNNFIKHISSLKNLLTVLNNPFLLRLYISPSPGLFKPETTLHYTFLQLNKLSLNKKATNENYYPNIPLFATNIQPHMKFKFIIFKKIYAFFTNNKIHKNIIPIYHNTLIRFAEHCSGKKILIQFYPFVNQSITKDFIIRYKT